MPWSLKTARGPRCLSVVSLVMTLKAWLEGDEYDLQHLVAILPTGDVRVVEEGDGFFLTSPELDACSDNANFEKIASQALDRLNGLGRLCEPSFRPVALSGRYDDGKNAIVFVEAATEIRFRATAEVVVHGADGVEKPPSTPIVTRFLGLAADPDVSEALGILGRSSDLSFVEMYKIYEIIQDRVGKLSTQGWGVTKRQEQSFTASACHPAISREKARHARQKGDPPARSMWMSEIDARAFIIRAMDCWLRDLDAGPRPADQSEALGS